MSNGEHVRRQPQIELFEFSPVGDWVSEILQHRRDCYVELELCYLEVLGQKDLFLVRNFIVLIRAQL